MGINLIIAVTDGDWFEMLRRQPDLGEVNFWAPSGAKLRALQPGAGELFCLVPSVAQCRLLRCFGCAFVKSTQTEMKCAEV